MKILRIYLRLPPKSGGMERHIASLSKEQLKAGHQVSIYYNSGHNVSSDDIAIAPFFELSKLKPAFVGIFIFYCLVILKLLRLRIKADVVHIHGDWGHLCLAGLVKKIVNAQCLAFTVHGELSEQGMRYRLLRYFIKPVTVAFATGFSSYQILLKCVTVPCYLQPSAINAILLNRAKLFIPTAREQSIRPVILSVCNYKKVKNIDLIILLASKMKDYDFQIVGEGEERENLQDKINALALKNVFLVGEKYGDELADCYERADLFLLTSFREGTPTATLEALSFGLPVVTSNAGGVSYLLKPYAQATVIADFNVESYEVAIHSSLNKARLKMASLDAFGWPYIANAITERYL